VLHKLWLAAAAGSVCLVTAAAAQRSEEQLLQLARAHRWFELRALVTDRSSPMVRGLVAAAFNDTATAERLLRDVIRTAPGSDAADLAYATLGRIYVRSGQYTRFATHYEAWAAAMPASTTVRDERQDYEKFRGRPNQINGPRRQSSLRHSPDGYLTLPISVDGKTDEFIFDTGAWQSALTEREAKKLGMTIRDDGRTLTDLSGTKTSFRTAVAKEVALGAMRFRDVSFAVITPGGALAGAEFGIIGLPIILAMGGIDWSNDGGAEFGGALRTTTREPNLVFTGGRLTVGVTVLGKDVLLAFDTGANGTNLNANFADAFPEASAQGKQGTSDLNGIGGTQTFASVELAELVFSIGGARVPLRPVVVTLQRNATAGGVCCVGNGGHDLLKQGSGFTIDLSKMVLQVR